MQKQIKRIYEERIVPRCIKCNSAFIYTLTNGVRVCRTCGYRGKVK